MMNVKNMEVGFSPPYGDDMNFRILPHLLDLFSPPYGDGIESYACAEEEFTFSPPYGDGMRIVHLIEYEWMFSPPYGDGILNISQNIAKLKSRMARKYSLY